MRSVDHKATQSRKKYTEDIEVFSSVSIYTLYLSAALSSTYCSVLLSFLFLLAFLNVCLFLISCFFMAYKAF